MTAWAIDRREVVLLLGARGFIGRRIGAALESAGYVVRPVSRRGGKQPGSNAVLADLATDTTPEAWLPRLAGVDYVVNAAGAFADRSENPLSGVHIAGPKALFLAAQRSGVRRIVQISALGADSGSTSYFATKSEADLLLMSLPVESAILRPSLVFGPEGGSASMFMLLATLPLVPIPRAFLAPVQPVHVDDLVEAVIILLGSGKLPAGPIPVVAGTPLNLRDYLRSLRRQLGYAGGRFIYMPDSLVTALARLPFFARRGYLSADALRMLAAGSTADVGPFAELLGRPPRAPNAFISPAESVPAASGALLGLMDPVMRLAVAAMWIWTGIVSLGLYPVQLSHQLLAQAGVPEPLRPAVLFGAALLDICIGIAVLQLYRHPWIWKAQILLILSYTAVISVCLPEYWLHPFGPITKNVPLLGMLFMLQLRAERRWNICW